MPSPMLRSKPPHTHLAHDLDVIDTIKGHSLPSAKNTAPLAQVYPSHRFNGHITVQNNPSITLTLQIMITRSPIACVISQEQRASLSGATKGAMNDCRIAEGRVSPNKNAVCTEEATGEPNKAVFRFVHPWRFVCGLLQTHKPAEVVFLQLCDVFKGTGRRSA